MRHTHTLNFLGRLIQLSFQHRDFSLAEEKLGLNLIGPASTPFWERDGNAYKTAVLLFIGICRSVPGLTLDQVREFITFENCGQIEELVNSAVVEALPKRREDEEGPGPEPVPTMEPEPTTGSGSGQSPSSTSDSPAVPSGA